MKRTVLIKAIPNRAVKWETEARETVSKIDHSPGEKRFATALAANGLLESGLDIIEAGKATNMIHTKIMPTQAQSVDTNTHGFSSLQPVLHTYGLIRLARLFKDPLWHLVYENPPAVEHIPNLEGLTSTSLVLMYRRLPYVGFESIFFLHFLPRMALEISHEEDRNRMLAMMRSILSKGFAITAAYISDVEMAWQFGDQLRISRGGNRYN